MAPERTIHDLRTRELVTSELGTTFLVEASAGTGKTRVLVDRYLRCVLDAERGAGDVRKVAAITFTEKAAAELRQRIREDLELRAQTAPAGSDLAARIAGALDALDDAPIGTIHGFAGRLLREFPVEARVDPAFEQLDELGAGLERERLWEEWVTGLAASDAAASPGRRRLSRLLRAGVRLDSVRTLAIGPKGVFGERYDLDPATQLADQPDLSAGLGRLAAPLQALAGFCAVACLDPSDKGYVAAADLVDACRRLADEPPADLDQLAAALYRLPVRETASAPGGAKGNWDAARGGKDALQLHYQALVAEVAVLRDAYAAFLTGLAVAVADEFSRWAGGTQLALGRLDFTDLLGCLRDLLKRDMGARRALQRRFRYVLVDEFQDTDPLQAEIVFFLCEHEPLATEWQEVVLEPGKLFVVGDPKQSIYRFRRADIAMYDQVKRLVAAQPAGGGAFNVISPELPHHTRGHRLGQPCVRRSLRERQAGGPPAGLRAGAAVPPARRARRGRRAARQTVHERGRRGRERPPGRGRRRGVTPPRDARRRRRALAGAGSRRRAGRRCRIVAPDPLGRRRAALPRHHRARDLRAGVPRRRRALPRGGRQGLLLAS